MNENLLRYDKNKTFVFIDLETFNLCLNFSHNLPWQIGMIKCKGESKIDEKNYYINWESDLKISEDAARITRYDHKKMEKNGLKIDKVFPTVKDWLDHADYIIGHNILGFDLYLIKELYKSMGCLSDHLISKIIDTNCISRGIKYATLFNSKNESLLEYQYKIFHTKRKDVKSSLSFLGKEYKIIHDYEKLHDALNDLDLNIKVWNKLKWQIEV